MPQKHSRRKANRKQPGGATTTAATAATKNDIGDPFHNRDHPCSKRLQNIAESIFDPLSLDAFSVLVQDYLCTSSIAAPPDPPSPNKKKKRKKKKKNKGMTELPEPQDTVNTTDFAEETMEETQQLLSAIDGMCLPRNRLEFLWEEYLLGGGDLDSRTLQRSREALESVTSRFSDKPMDESLVDSVARPFLRQEMIERRMDRVLEVFLQRFSPSDKASSAAGRLDAFLEHCCADTEHPFFVPIKLVEEAVRNIGCPACRRDVQCLLEQSHTARQTLHLEGATFETIMDDYERNDYELDSMYQIMEEGSLPLRDLPKWKFEAVQRGEEKGWILIRPFDRQPQWTVSDLDFLLKHGLLAMGLPDVDVFPLENTISASGVSVALVDHQVNDLLSRLERIDWWVREAGEKVHEGEPTDEGIDLDSFGHLQQADEKCDLILNDLLGIAIKVTSAVNYAQAHYGRNHSQQKQEIEANVYWATKQCNLLWGTFLDCVKNVMDHMNLYEVARFAIADNRGAFEEMYISFQARRLYFDYVRQKVKYVASAASTVKDRLLYPTQLGNNSTHSSMPVEFVIRLFIEEAYFRSSQSQQPHIQIDQAFADVMTVLREVVETVHGPNIDRIVRENHIRWSKFWRIADGIRESILQTKACVRSGEHSESYEQKLQDLSRQVAEILDAFKLCDAEPEWERVCLWRKETCHKLKSLLPSWSTLTIFALDNGSREALSALSRSGLESLLNNSHLDALSSRFGRCRGGKGTSRLVASLVGVAFEIIVDKFHEYQSEVAMQELLNDAEKKVETKKNTKKKKRKETIETSASVKSILDEPESSSLGDTSVTSLEPTALQTVIYEAPPENVEDLVVSSRGPSEMDEVGIYDGSVFIPAETFLLGRLDTLLKSGDDIVFVS